MALRLAVLGCAVLLTALDLAKPLVIDDAAYHAFARHIAEHPGDPYGFQVFWYSAPQPANQVLAPPVFLYWWAAGLRLLGDDPLLWKLWMFPFALLLCAALGALLRRFAPRVAAPMLCALALSPPILPALNLMLDLPALALALAGLLLLLRACDEDRLSLALLAGLVAGLSLETKYTAVLPLVAGLGHAFLMGRVRLAVAAGAVASVLFVGWELWMHAAYGASHFAEGVRRVGELGSFTPLHWVGSILSLLGSSALGTGLLALLALGVPRSAIAAALLLATAGVAGIAWLPGAPQVDVDSLFPAWRQELWIFLPLGAGVLAALVALAWRVGRPFAGGAGRADGTDAAAAADRFVLLWLGVELVGFFLVSPYPALRRLIGVQVAAGLLVARALSQGGREGVEHPAWMHGLVAWSAALGLLFAVSDVTDARTRRDAFERALARLDREPSLAQDGTHWYAGHWGFQFLAERAGLRPMVPGESRLAPGDAVMVPSGVYRQPFHVPGASLVLVDLVAGRNAWPWSTLPWAYLGHPPLRPQPDVQIRIRLGRVVAPATVLPVR